MSIINAVVAAVVGQGFPLGTRGVKGSARISLYGVCVWEGRVTKILKSMWWRDVVSCASNGYGLTSPKVGVLPLSKKIDHEIASESSVQYLREEIQIGNKSSLKNDRNVRGVE